MELPDALWSKVLSCLALKDLLNARLVCKTFVQLGQLPELQLDWAAGRPEASSSLMLFASRHLMHPSSPLLSIIVPYTIEGNECYLHLQLSLACQCLNLRYLDIYTVLDLGELQSLLKMLPTGVSRLNVMSSGDLVKIIEEPSWSRLAALTDLQLELPRGAQQTSTQGSLLAHLSGLKSLTLTFSGPDDDDGEAVMMNSRVFKAANFLHQGITRLEIGDDPIRGHLDLAQLPALRTILLSQGCDVPIWLQGQHFETLQL